MTQADVRTKQDLISAHYATIRRIRADAKDPDRIARDIAHQEKVMSNALREINRLKLSQGDQGERECERIFDEIALIRTEMNADKIAQMLALYRELNDLGVDADKELAR